MRRTIGAVVLLVAGSTTAVANNLVTSFYNLDKDRVTKYHSCVQQGCFTVEIAEQEYMAPPERYWYYTWDQTPDVKTWCGGTLPLLLRTCMRSDLDQSWYELYVPTNDQWIILNAKDEECLKGALSVDDRYATCMLQKLTKGADNGK